MTDKQLEGFLHSLANGRKTIKCKCGGHPGPGRLVCVSCEKEREIGV